MESGKSREAEGMERCADVLDYAALLADSQARESIQSIRRAAAPEQQCINGEWETEVCVDCEEPIEPGRLEMGRIRCFSCQSLLERKRRGY